MLLTSKGHCLLKAPEYLFCMTRGIPKSPNILLLLKGYPFLPKHSVTACAKIISKELLWKNSVRSRTLGMKGRVS